MQNDQFKFLRDKGFNVYEKGRLNILAIRRKPFRVNEFNDDLFIFWRDKETENWFKLKYKITTLPGKYWLTNLLNKKGTAILAPGQYINSYRIGLHKGKKALLQIRPVKVYRDSDLDEEFDFTESSLEEGHFGINIHRAGAFSLFVNSWSAGCQVFKKEKDFEEFIGTCEDRAGFSNQVFTYTLIEAIN